MFLSRQLAHNSNHLPLGMVVNSYKMATQHNATHCASVCTPDGFAMKQRVARLKRELRANLAKSV